LVEEGFRALKLKGGKNADDDAERVVRVREAVGPKVGLRFDANQGYDLEQSLRFVERTKSAKLELLEQPTPRGEADLMGRVVEGAPIPVMADENQVLMASPNPLVPDIEEDLRLRLGKQIRTVLCTAASINGAVAKYYSQDSGAAATAGSDSPRSQKTAARSKKTPATAAETKRQRLLLTIVSFNLAVMLLVFLVFTPLRGGLYRLAVIDYILVVLLSAIVAAVAYVVVPKLTD
jgi:hypothetical protein